MHLIYLFNLNFWKSLSGGSFSWKCVCYLHYKQNRILLAISISISSILSESPSSFFCKCQIRKKTKQLLLISSLVNIVSGWSWSLWVTFSISGLGSSICCWWRNADVYSNWYGSALWRQWRSLLFEVRLHRLYPLGSSFFWDRWHTF
jgi:hypothetical protein